MEKMKLQTKIKEEGRYIYCVALGKEEDFGSIGINKEKVYTICYKDICVVVHNCWAKPYVSDDPAVVKKWVEGHQNVIDTAVKKFSTVLPFGFDRIIKAKRGFADNVVKNWLRQEYDKLRRKIEILKGKEEYAIRIFWNRETGANKLINSNPKLKDLSKKIKNLSEGAAYIHRKNFEIKLKEEIEKEADNHFKKIYNKVHKVSEDIKINSIKDSEMLAHFSCLVNKGYVEKLGNILDKINKTGFSVQFTGPWPPYSFC